MKNFTLGQVIGIPVALSKKYAEEDLPGIPVSTSESVAPIKERKRSSFNWIRKFRRSSEDTSKGEGIGHETFRQNSSSETAKITREAHRCVERSFRKSFSVDQDERLLMGYCCYLYTTDGPIQGILFMSTKKIAFCSDKPLLFTSPKGEIVQVPYKVLIPVSKIKEVTPSKNVNKPKEKYLHIVTIDNFEFWFSSFVKQKRSSKSL